MNKNDRCFCQKCYPQMFFRIYNLYICERVKWIYLSDSCHFHGSNLSNLTISLTLPHRARDDTGLNLNRMISKMLRVNIAFTTTF